MARRKQSRAQSETPDTPEVRTEGATEMPTPTSPSLRAAADVQAVAETVRAETPPPEQVAGTGIALAVDGETPAVCPTEAFVIETAELAPEEAARILQKRAHDLAQVPPAEEKGEAIQVIAFALGEETYAVESSYVGGIHVLEGLTPVPCTPDYCAGVVNLRGRILSVVDIHRFLGLPGITASGTAEVIVVHAAGLEVGILADHVFDARSLPLTTLQPVLPTTSRAAAEYTRGVTPDMLVLLDLPALLGDRRIVVHEEVT